MKKTLTILALTGLTSAAFAQGTVQWQSVAGNFIGSTNSASYSSYTPTIQTTTGASGVTVGSASTLFYYELLVSASSSTAPTTATALANNWQDTGLEAQNAAAANGRILQLLPAANATANHWAAGVTENIMLVGWSANLGTTYAGALSDLQNWSTVGSTIVGPAYFGTSALGDMASGTGNPGPLVFGTGAGQINNGSGNPMVMNLLAPAVVPEPGTMALAGLGGLSLLAFRRKK
jgi:hypothetical protein